MQFARALLAVEPVGPHVASQHQTHSAPRRTRLPGTTGLAPTRKEARFGVLRAERRPTPSAPNTATKTATADGQECVCFEGSARGADRSLSSWSARTNVAHRSRRQLERPWATTTPSTQHTTSAHDFVRARAREREAKEKSANKIQENTPRSTSLPQCARAKENRTAHPGAAIEIGQSRYPKTSLLCRRMFSLGSLAS